MTFTLPQNIKTWSYYESDLNPVSGNCLYCARYHQVQSTPFLSITSGCIPWRICLWFAC
ncbi:Uncharacterised protein [Vibrio cholerae]|uniref:Uncharacterized protein n=1 Tax=Vibrio cholerae TaxID=666 RepID=A0A655YP00_VIBCL|nr:Uncharacterised protein [Vibrio cholerae]CSA05726.1 Uncharacterised protein [Vibrio cholerae]CSA33572.1 Uncharacterised protein [Vibrio cholerae]CSB24925.1 Uncharacterised protein [Vibrio cholerae]CSB32186.1 Uncharacterised protein [Vibrio cholerae]